MKNSKCKMQSVMAAALVICGLGVTGAGANAQTATNAPASPESSFYSTVLGWFSSQNTNLVSTFATDAVDVNVGAAYVNNVDTASTLGIEWMAYRPVSLEEETYNAGIAGTVLAQEAGVGLNATVVDMRFTGHVDGGYDFANARSYVKAGVRVKKALTANTYMGADLSVEEALNNRPAATALSPTLELFTGFKF